MGDDHLGVVISMPTVAMLVGSMAVFVCRLPDKVQACFQMFSAGLRRTPGLLISAVANELFPLLKPAQSQLPLLVGFTVGLIFMFGLGYLTEFMEEDEEDGEVVTQKRTTSDIETALVDICEQERQKAKEHFQVETKELHARISVFFFIEIDVEVNHLLAVREWPPPGLQDFLMRGSQNQIDEILHSLEYRVHKATRVLYVRSGLDDQNLTRMQFHGRELKQASERLQRFESFQKAKDNLKAFQACLEHLHGHAERAPFRRWKAMSKPAEDQQLSEQLPLALVMAVVVDAAVDGMLIGLSYAASPRCLTNTDPNDRSRWSRVRMAASAFVAPSAEPTTQRSATLRGAQRSSSSSATSTEIGACDPLLFWDPIGYCGGDCTKEDFDRRRAVELKHGRSRSGDVFGKFDGYLSPSQSLKFADVPSGLAAISKLTTELNNGRLAMISVTGMLIQNGLTGQSPVEQLTSGHISPFNDGQGFFAFDASKELGACPPLGYWDPFGMMAFQDEEKFRRNRELELKHGRICMVATIGMIVPDLFGRFGGDLSPSMGLKFSDIPCTIEAIYKVPAAGWLQVFALAGAIEAKNLAFPTNYGYPPFWGQIDKLEPEEKQKKLLAEINNGRLAMVAMAAIVAQNGATGQSLVEQFTTGNLNPFIGGYARADKVAMKVAADGFFSGKAGNNSEAIPWEPTSGAKFEPFITRYPTDSSDPLKAATQVPIVGWLQILVVIALSELWRYENVISKYDQGVAPGDLGWNPTAPTGTTRPKWFGPTFSANYTQEDDRFFLSFSPTGRFLDGPNGEWNNMRLREIKHCRLAMVGFFFMVLTNASTGQGPSLLPTYTQEEFQSTVGDFIPKGL
eukprot:g3352.t2